MDQLFLSVVNHQHETDQANNVNGLSSNLSGSTMMLDSEDRDSKLEVPIPPLHVQQKFLNDSNKVYNNDNVKYLRSTCLRCKKEFDQPLIVPKRLSDDEVSEEKPLIEPKIFKLCQHCRELQRQRLRRWQKKTKEKVGVCRRCGNDIPPELQKFVLCLSCRQNLRFRKANRARQGRCVHCLGPLDTSIITNNGDEPAKKERNFKVCKRCRENDKIRRNNLEKLGNCNRCAKPLSEDDIGKHKVCKLCRNKKKKNNITDPMNPMANLGINLVPGHDPSLMHDMNLFGLYNQQQIQQQISQALQPQNPVPQGQSHPQPLQVHPVQAPLQVPVNLQQVPNVYGDMMRQNLPISNIQLPIQNQSPQVLGHQQAPQMNMIQGIQPITGLGGNLNSNNLPPGMNSQQMGMGSVPGVPMGQYQMLPQYQGQGQGGLGYQNQM